MKDILNAIRILTTRPEYFRYGNHLLPYLNHRLAFNTERSVEIPIAVQWLDLEKSTLEVGNSLAPFAPIETRTVVDKYEKADKVISCDITDFDPGHRYEQILSISTMEHVGFDETEKTPGKCKAAFERLESALLAAGGRILITLPVGYNPEADELIKAHKDRCRFMARTTKNNQWIETDYAMAMRCRYATRFPFANAIAIYE